MNFYRQAATSLDYLDKHQGSVKGSLAAAKVETTPSESRRVLALIIETLKYRDALTELLTKVPLMKLEKETFRYKSTPSSKNLLLVLLHDLLFSQKGKIEASDKWPPKPAVMKYQARLKAELVRLQLKAGKRSIRDLGREGTAVAARYVRWNPNAGPKWSLDALHTHLKTLGMELVTEVKYPVPEGTYFMDPHLPDCLLVFPPSSTWWVGDEWYESGAVVLQDKASCFPAAVVMDGWKPEDGACLDATAAPGNKTSFMSALMGNKGVLYAFEKSEYRYRTLGKMLNKAKCSNVQATRGDFTETRPGDYPDVTRILLDPSCSGSGIVNRLDYLVDQEEAEETANEQGRLEKLAAFQLQMIQHAFKFPNVTRVVYSTCSIHAEEDERVVSRALANKGWKLAPRESVLPTWERRGLPEELEGAESVIRCLPEDKTNGFFVACFERRNEEETRIAEEAEVASKVRAAVEAKDKAAEEREKEKAAAVAAATDKVEVKSGNSGKATKVKAAKAGTEKPKAKATGTGDVAADKTRKRSIAESETTAEPATKKTKVSVSPAVATPKEPAPKTEAQAERLRRKKKAQKAKTRK